MGHQSELAVAPTLSLFVLIGASLVLWASPAGAQNLVCVSSGVRCNPPGDCCDNQCLLLNGGPCCYFSLGYRACGSYCCSANEQCCGGGWGCAPKTAVCCNDGEHYCDANEKCCAGGTCVRASGSCSSGTITGPSPTGTPSTPTSTPTPTPTTTPSPTPTPSTPSPTPPPSTPSPTPPPSTPSPTPPPSTPSPTSTPEPSTPAPTDSTPGPTPTNPTPAPTSTEEPQDPPDVPDGPESPTTTPTPTPTPTNTPTPTLADSTAICGTFCRTLGGIPAASVASPTNCTCLYPLVVRYRLADKNLSDWEPTFQRLFTADVASRLQVQPAQIGYTSVQQGSILLDAYVTPQTGATFDNFTASRITAVLSRPLNLSSETYGRVEVTSVVSPTVLQPGAPPTPSPIIGTGVAVGPVAPPAQPSAPAVLPTSGGYGGSKGFSCAAFLVVTTTSYEVLWATIQ